MGTWAAVLETDHSITASLFSPTVSWIQPMYGAWRTLSTLGRLSIRRRDSHKQLLLASDCHPTRTPLETCPGRFACLDIRWEILEHTCCLVPGHISPWKEGVLPCRRGNLLLHPGDIDPFCRDLANTKAAKVRHMRESKAIDASRCLGLGADCKMRDIECSFTWHRESCSLSTNASFLMPPASEQFHPARCEVLQPKFNFFVPWSCSSDSITHLTFPVWTAKSMG